MTAGQSGKALVNSTGGSGPIPSLTRVDGTSFDGTLVEWEDLEDLHPWDTLLVGNGLSSHVWRPFGYRSLFENSANNSTILQAPDRKLFEAHGTTNFELVLSELRSAVKTAEALGEDPTPYLTRYRLIQQALGDAVRGVHIERENVSDGILASIKATLRDFEWVFTTNYDLLIYWAMGADGSWKPCCDGFYKNSRNEFEPKFRPNENQIPIYFLHGALHLVELSDGTTVKRVRQRDGLSRILDGFGKPFENDEGARPLLVTEGSFNEKLQAISANAYLLHCLEMLAERKLPMVIFGSSIGESDQHLIEAIARHPDRPVAISMQDGDKADLMVRQADIWGRLNVQPLYFFRAESHPLGRPELEAKRLPGGVVTIG